MRITEVANCDALRGHRKNARGFGLREYPAFNDENGSTRTTTRVCGYYDTPKADPDVWGYDPSLTNHVRCEKWGGVCVSPGHEQHYISNCDPSHLLDNDARFCFRLAWGGYVPDFGSTSSPVFIYHSGTSSDLGHYSEPVFLAEMVNRGFCAFWVEQPHNYGPLSSDYNRGWFAQKAQWIYSNTNPRNALQYICAVAGCDCDKGIVTAGFSQGAHIASYAKKFDSRVKATLILGGGCRSKQLYAPEDASASLVYTYDSYMKSGHPCYNQQYDGGINDVFKVVNVPQERFRSRADVRAIGGAYDNMFGAQEQMLAITGYRMTECRTTLDCIQPDGSGFFLVMSFEDRVGNNENTGHEFFGVDAFVSNFRNHSYPSPWTIRPNFDWLAARGHGRSYTEPNYLFRVSPMLPQTAPTVNTVVARFNFCGWGGESLRSCESGFVCRQGQMAWHHSKNQFNPAYFCCFNNYDYNGKCKFGGHEYKLTHQPCMENGQCDWNHCDANLMPQIGGNLWIDGRCRYSKVRDTAEVTSAGVLIPSQADATISLVHQPPSPPSPPFRPHPPIPPPAPANPPASPRWKPYPPTPSPPPSPTATATDAATTRR